MAFTNIGTAEEKKVQFDQGNGGLFDPCFSPGDISNLLQQPGAVAVQMVKAIVGKGGNARPCLVLIALHTISYNPDGTIKKEGRMADPSQLVALPNPPFIFPAGSFLPEPVPSPGY